MEECLPLSGRTSTSVTNVPRERWNQPHEREHLAGLGERLAAAEPEPRQSVTDAMQEAWLTWGIDGPRTAADWCKVVTITAERLVAAAEAEGAEKDALLARADNLLGHASHSDSRCEPPDGRSMESWCSVCSWREDLAAASPLPDTETPT